MLRKKYNLSENCRKRGSAKKPFQKRERKGLDLCTHFHLVNAPHSVESVFLCLQLQHNAVYVAFHEMLEEKSMAYKQCPECGKAISDTDTFCKNCGFPLDIQSDNSGDDSFVSIANSNTDEPRYKTSNKKPLIIICIISTLLVMLLAIGFAIAFNSPTEPVEMNFINDSLLADIRQTYGEISAKYVDATSINGFEGDLYANISGRQYCFVPGKDRTSAYSGDFDSIMPNDDAVCVSIDAAARDLFFEFSGGMSSSDLEYHGFSATVVSSRPSATAGEVEGNYCYFEYEDCEVYILLAENSDVFFPNSQVFIKLRK